MYLSRDFLLGDYSIFDIEHMALLARTLNSLDNCLNSSHTPLCIATQQNEEAVFFRLTCVTTPVLISSPNTLKIIFFISSGGRGLRKKSQRQHGNLFEDDKIRH